MKNDKATLYKTNVENEMLLLVWVDENKTRQTFIKVIFTLTGLPENKI